MKTLAFILVGIVAASGCSKLFGPRVTDSGKQGSRTVAVGKGKALESFKRVESRGSFDVEIKQGPQSDVVVEGDESIIKIVRLKVDGDTLIVDTQGSFSTSTRLVVKITMPTVEGVEMDGSGEATLTNVSGDKLDLDISGSGEIVASGKVKDLSARISGSGDIDATALESVDAKTNVSGSGSIRVFATKSLDADIAGSGGIQYKGSPQVKKDISGSGDVSPI
ncbi:MAG: DUF2807 domain-containing protein [Chlorobia bacterium]|nr:DUF2807 domain-containing protein [Fimbriimonadaceae bacterium]